MNYDPEIILTHVVPCETTGITCFSVFYAASWTWNVSRREYSNASESPFERSSPEYLLRAGLMRIARVEGLK